MERITNEDESEPKMEGYLEKKRKTRLVSLWHRYWFILEGAQLSYYENHPSSAATPCKGILRLTPMTSVTAYSPTRCPTALQSHFTSCEIYILNPSKLVTLRTKDVNDHKTWMCALLGQIALLDKALSRGHLSVITPRITVSGPFQSSHIQYRHSLTSLTPVEESANVSSKKCSRTMEYKDPNISKFKSGSTGNMIDREVIVGNSVIDIDTSSEEDGVFDRANAAGSDEATGALRNRDNSSPISSNTTKMSNSEENDIANSEETALGKQLTRSVEDENKSEASRGIQSREHKIKSRKFFGRKESKANSLQTSCKKVYKKCRDTVATDREVAETKLFRENKDEQKSKFEECLPKDETHTSGFKSPDSANDCKVPIGNVLQNPSTESFPPIPEKREDIKSPNKAKMKRDKNKKYNKINQPSFEVQSNRKSKLSKTNEPLEDGETKTKMKKMGFFSKLVKHKRSESLEDKSETMEENPKVELSREPEIPVDEPSSIKDVLPEEIRSQAPSQRSRMGLKLISKDDAELQKKLLSRMLKLQANQESPSEVEIRENIRSKSPVPLPRKKAEVTNLSNPVHDGDDGMKPVLFPKSHQHMPALSERTNSSIPLGFRRNLPPENFPSLNPKPKLSPKSTEKIQIPEAEIKSNYDQVKFKVKNRTSESVKPNINYSHGIHAEPQIVVIDESASLSSEPQIVVINESASHSSIGTNSYEFYNENANMDMEESAVEVDKKSRENKDVDVHFDRGSVLIPTVTFSDMSSHAFSSNYAEHSSAPFSSSPKCPSQEPFSSSSPETGERIFNKNDELGFLFSELDRINALPLENADSEEITPLMPEKVKRISSDTEDFLEAYPIRKRRNSDPDYDIPRPHRLPKHQEVSQDNDSNPSTQKDKESRDRDTANSILIEATCFLGPGMDQSFNENRYYGLNDNDWNKKCDGMKNYEDGQSSESDAIDERVSFHGNSNLNLDYFSGVYNEEGAVKKDDRDSKVGDNYFYDTSKSSPISRQDSEVSVHLRAENIDRVCRSERSREIYESDIEDLLFLTGSMDGLSITRRLDEGQSIETPNQENGTLLQVDVSSDEFEEKCLKGELVPEDCVSRLEIKEQFEEMESIANANKKAVESLKSTNNERSPQEIQFDLEEPKVILRHAVRPSISDYRENKTLRLSFATTETLIVEEEVLVASLKTTTTTTFSTPAAEVSSSETKDKVEESVEEVVLDMDAMSDDHFGPMQIQSCVQT